MRVIVQTSDPEVVTEEAVAAALEKAGFFVATVTIEHR